MSATSPDPYEYSALFFDYIEEGALRSARTIVPLVAEALHVRSVLDVGCGAGAWLVEYERLGAEILGIDREYVPPESLLVPIEKFRALDVTQPFDLGRRFDLVQCLEVAEHISPAASDILVSNLVSHSDFVLFSAAVPGQGGEHHVNERPPAFWRKLFLRSGYLVFDPFRARLMSSDAEPWYALNTLLYVRESSVETLPETVRGTVVQARSPIPDLSPATLKLQRLALRCLPVPIVTRLAIWKHSMRVRSRTRD